MGLKSISEAIGWYGITAVLIAYSFASLGFLSTGSIIYLMLNLTGAIGILYHSYKKKDYQPVVLNIIWALIALIAILRLVI